MAATYKAVQARQAFEVRPVQQARRLMGYIPILISLTVLIGGIWLPTNMRNFPAKQSRIFVQMVAVAVR
jgi:hypothetical protein